MNKKSRFPKDFLWGVATASYQVEGGIENCDWAKAGREGKVPVCGRACDHYNRYEEDFDIARELGHNAHRFSVEWARIEPEEGKFDEKEIEHYKNVLHALHARNITPLVTLWHFTLPLWFSESSGWERKDAPEIFARYCTYVVEQFGDLCKNYSTMNEPIVYSSNGWVRGIWPPFLKFSIISRAGIIKPKLELNECAKENKSSVFTYLKIRSTLAKAHNKAYSNIKKVNKNTDVSIVKNVIVFDADKNPINKIKARVLNHHWTFSFMNKVAKKSDSIGLNFYFYKKFGDKKVYEKTDMNWDIVPEKISKAIMMLNKYKKPIYVAEAGIADAQDKHRAKYIQGTVDGIRSAVIKGSDVRGFCYWSLLDNYEWAAGFREKFGLVEVDYETLERKIRPSAYVYKNIIMSEVEPNS